MAHCLYQTPHERGLNRSRWWLAGLRQAISWLASYSLSGIWRLLKRLGFSYRRAREHVHSPDPAYEAKLRAVQKAVARVRAAPQRYVLLYQDEMTYYRRPGLAWAYAPCGSKAPVAQLGYKGNTKCRIAASLDITWGRLTCWQRSRFDRHTLLRYYRHLQATYPAAETIFLVQDNWPVHHHPDIQHWLSTSRIVVLPLPTYAPWTNYAEKVWRRLRQEVLHVHPFEDDWPSQQAQVQRWLDQWAEGSFDLLHYVGLFPY